ncbi:phytanoyl-CoA dioxygenase family protein [Aeromicrobium fastidiosum]|uniref:Phytanoyl-CoA dioxygenase n=1 Tax=Aeromicrobium fastidiosum TaxID=52699 RepID=A0A641AM72_9ACTN|nr:phytanoyl-CoA dioxygenase family protein [Aeromicrobium fastidiosum]KAA1378368.1 phytanoyl-CoA dioxygenase [Aeromicrobium fastidiosum]MBP2392680.1 ectoine hydroxylase-related dioxygenase (phytanoyl-CoA dioxygenase family) [Aeromicrobium fastidiosum]
MTATIHGTTGRSPRLHESDCSVDDFDAVVRATTDVADYPHADRVEQGVLVYESAVLRAATSTEAGSAEVEGELVRALSDGPGVVALKGAFTDPSVIDRVTAVFDEIIVDERAAGTAPGDHFAKPGANSRVWNALEKLAVRDPGAFVDYYANDVLALISRAWLGPAYQVTSQVNVVRPGGVAQDPHRDYHLGFLSNEVVERYPAHVHVLSPVLTLQGAVAHSDMPVESGPTMYLPHSHQYAPGYLAWRLPEFREYFAEHHVQLPLAKGDAAFFNPAVFHGAGTNVSTDVQRMANLLQVSSAFGRAMESVDRARVSKAVYPALLERLAAGAGSGLVANAVAASAEGYPFPTNLDLDANVNGLTPLSQAEIVQRALAEGWTPAELDDAIDAGTDRRRTDG